MIQFMKATEDVATLQYFIQTIIPKPLVMHDCPRKCVEALHTSASKRGVTEFSLVDTLRIIAASMEDSLPSRFVAITNDVAEEYASSSNFYYGTEEV